LAEPPAAGINLNPSGESDIPVGIQ
jgi:hypothetical protein